MHMPVPNIHMSYMPVFHNASLQYAIMSFILNSYFTAFNMPEINSMHANQFLINTTNYGACDQTVVPPKIKVDFNPLKPLMEEKDSKPKVSLIRTSVLKVGD